MFEIADIGLYEMDNEGQMNVATRTVNCLSLCSGIGGLELGLSLVVPGFRVVCHVEREASVAALLVARMEDKSMDDAPIWDDLTTFDGAAWRGTVDIVAAGFPCQPWSTAGKRKGTEDERWIWSDIIRIIREVRPGVVFLENVPGLLVHAGLGGVLGELAEAGFDAEWGCFTAAEVGASHRRERVFILGNTASSEQWIQRECQGESPIEARRSGGDVADTEYGRRGSREANPRRQEGHTSRNNGEPVADTECEGVSRRGVAGDMDGEALGFEREASQRERSRNAALDCSLAFPPHPNDLEGWARVLAEMPSLEPAVCRMADGTPNRVDRLRALGNAVVPLEAAHAFVSLTQRVTLPMQL
ncbi:hypothetical protein LCGC14_0353320 [marine sediment metagenome]|uniref:DNA (cytosine-5-)-methyltransferase n=1 Tax=marine sediment metagenome TaxID=412755 RepID=A0A0F9TA33_9ZZZZ